jgi:hypothetical protein
MRIILVRWPYRLKIKLAIFYFEAKLFFEVPAKKLYLCIMENQSILSHLLSLYLTPVISAHFEVQGIQESTHRIDLRLEERPELIPASLQGTDAVLDGFCNEVELQTFAVSERAVFLHIFRRRWKAKGTDRHYSNTCDLHPPGVKATHEFAAFLKEQAGCTPEQYYAYICDEYDLGG